MASLCAFGGFNGDLSLDGGVQITLFGGSELRRPPAARQVALLRRRPAGADEHTHHYFLTVFGSCELKWPTMAQEFLALREALRSGACTLDDWDRLVGTALAGGPLRIHALTLMAGFDAHELPAEDAELDDLSLQRHFGHVPEEAVDLLMQGIGQPAPQRLAIVRQAIATALATGS